MPQRIHCTSVRVGASRSRQMTARLRVAAGSPSQRKEGEMLIPSAVCCTGIFPPSMTVALSTRSTGRSVNLRVVSTLDCSSVAIETPPTAPTSDEVVVTNQECNRRARVGPSGDGVPPLELELELGCWVVQH